LYNDSRTREAGENLSEEHIAWHPAFVEAIQAELEEYRDVLEFHAEHQLTAEPLRIDVLVVKKRADVVIEKNIARIFRACNIIEYKSPSDYVSRSDFQKAQGYAWFYASLHDVPTQDLTVTLVTSRYSHDVIEHLKTDLRCVVEKSEPGLYVVRGMPMPVQMIDSTELNASDNMWLRNLRRIANAESLAEMLSALQKRGKKAPLRAYAYALFTAADPDAMKEVKRKMATSMELFEIFRDVFGFDKEWEEKVRGEGREEGMKEGMKEGRKEGMKVGQKKGMKKEQMQMMKMAKNLLARGVDPIIIAESSGLALDKIQKIAASL
jgi:hypothetical protein